MNNNDKFNPLQALNDHSSFMDGLKSGDDNPAGSDDGEEHFYEDIKEGEGSGDEPLEEGAGGGEETAKTKKDKARRQKLVAGKLIGFLDKAKVEGALFTGELAREPYIIKARKDIARLTKKRTDGGVWDEIDQTTFLAATQYITEAQETNNRLKGELPFDSELAAEAAECLQEIMDEYDVDIPAWAALVILLFIPFCGAFVTAYRSVKPYDPSLVTAATPKTAKLEKA